MTAPQSGPVPLSEALRSRTAEIHHEAERSGIVADILRRKADSRGYALLLRNLLPAYMRIEELLSRHQDHPHLGPFAQPALHRANAVRSDLESIAGENWEHDLPLLDTTARYVECISDAGSGDGLRLIPHGYVRYFGDLSGGQILKKLLGQSMNLPPESLSLYDFPDISEIAAFKNRLRDSIDAAGQAVEDPEVLIAEALLAFQMNVDLSNDVQAYVASSAEAKPASA